jgi:hypothetical protein
MFKALENRIRQRDQQYECSHDAGQDSEYKTSLRLSLHIGCLCFHSSTNLLLDRNFISKSYILKEFFSKRSIPYLLRGSKMGVFCENLTACGVTPSLQLALSVFEPWVDVPHRTKLTAVPAVGHGHLRHLAKFRFWLRVITLPHLTGWIELSE